MEKVIYKPITTLDEIEYVCKDELYGRAEFFMCPVFKYGILKEVYISALQQMRNNKHWVLKLPQGKWRHFQIEAWTHKTDSPKIWMQGWCKQHKTIYHRVYVPDNTNRITFSTHFGDTLSMRFENK